MRLSLFIARRYLFSKKKQSAINIISAISVVGVAVGTTALVVILSVFNGIDVMLQKSMSSLTPDVVISPEKGKFATFPPDLLEKISGEAGVLYCNPVVEETALLKYGDMLKPVIVRGVTAGYGERTGLEKNMIRGDFLLRSGEEYTAVLGYGIAAELGIGLNAVTSLRFYYPNRKATSATASALNSVTLFPAGLFASQYETDTQLVITDIQFARSLFGVGEQLSKVELKLSDPGETEKIKNRLKQYAGTDFKVEDKYERNRSFYSMMKSEKLVIFLILLFILLIASFNIVGSISMLILDKKEDLNIYKAMGMKLKRIVSVFKTEGNMITVLGGCIGLCLGVLICLLQEKFGFIKLGEATYMVEAYPVKVVFTDMLWIGLSVFLIGYVASYFPVKYLINKLIK